MASTINKMILSICVPTFNGGDKLKYSIEALCNAVQGHDNVEIIVSDNCSTDDTGNILKSFDSCPNLKIFRNDENLGFNGNLLKILEIYASGEYCWIIGDDDCIDSDAIKLLLPFLMDIKPLYLSVKHRDMTLEEFIHLKNDERIIDFECNSFFNCIDANASDSNMLGTFMSSHIFKLEDVKVVDKSWLGDNTWTCFKTTFPNSYLMTLAFGKEQNCICIKTPLVTALTFPKTWNDKMYSIVMDIIPSYYAYCKKLLEKNDSLENNKKIINSSIACYNLLEIKSLRLMRVKWKKVCSKEFFILLSNSIKKRIL